MATKNFKFDIAILADGEATTLPDDFVTLEARIFRQNGGFEKKWSNELPLPPGYLTMVISDDQILVTLDDTDWDSMAVGDYRYEVITSQTDPDMEDTTLDDNYNAPLLRKTSDSCAVLLQ